MLVVSRVSASVLSSARVTGAAFEVLSAATSCCSGPAAQALALPATRTKFNMAVRTASVNTRSPLGRLTTGMTRGSFHREKMVITPIASRSAKKYHLQKSFFVLARSESVVEACKRDGDHWQRGVKRVSGGLVREDLTPSDSAEDLRHLER